MPKMTESRIAILATHGYERSELRAPLEAFRDQGAEVEILSIHPGDIRSWDDKDWGDSVPVDHLVSDALVETYQALILPGGQINPDILRTDPAAVAFIRDFAASGKPVAAICHGPWLLIEADLLRGRSTTSWPSLRTDITNAGGQWRDEPAVVDGNLVTSRNPGDLPAFIAALATLITEARPAARVAEPTA